MIVVTAKPRYIDCFSGAAACLIFSIDYYTVLSCLREYILLKFRVFPASYRLLFPDRYTSAACFFNSAPYILFLCVFLGIKIPPSEQNLIFCFFKYLL